MAQVICGVDISSVSLEACLGPDGPSGSFPNHPKGIAALASFCQEQGVELVALEATDGYEKQPFALLWAQGLPVAVLNPRAVRLFSEGMGLLEKTDRLDAQMLIPQPAVPRSVPPQPCGLPGPASHIAHSAMRLHAPRAHHQA